MRYFKKLASAALAALLAAGSLLSLPAAAEEHYDVYNYDRWEEAIPSQAGYLAKRSVSGKDLGVGDFSEPSDLFRDAHDRFFIVDTKNNRIVVTNAEMDEVVMVMEEFTMPDGSKTTLKAPEGIYVSPETDLIYIADYSNSRVLICDEDANVQQVITKPDAELFSQELTFLPQKVLADKAGNVYIVLGNITTGAAMFNAEGEFQGYYGANTVEATSQVIANYFWKLISTEEMRSRQARTVPSGITNFDLDDEGFIYTCTQSTSQKKDTVKKLNPAGNNLFVRDLRQKDSQFIQMTDNMDYQYEPVYDEGGKLYLYTNYGAPKGRIMTANLQRPGLSEWQEFIPEQQNVLNGVDVINRQFILNYSQDACDHAFVYGLDGKMRHEVKLPMVGSVGFTGDEKEPECFYTFTSFTMPGTIYRYDMAKNESTLYTQPNVKFRQQDYESKQIFFTSKDGTRVPMFITYKRSKGQEVRGERKARPVFLYGYGGFNIALGPSFSAIRIPFLELGGIYAQVNLRGGSEYGEEWHLAGTKMQKQNVFDDFISAAEYLIKEGYTSKEKLAIVGGSNGGLLVGACMTQRPDLFRVAIPQVGVMDMLRYHKFTIGWNWASDYGTSEDSKEMFEYLKGYSPLHNLKKGTSYPATLVTTADHDDRVVPAHSFKFAATLQECHEGANPVLIRIDTKAGHGGGKPLAKVLEEQADIYSFILYNMGLKYK